MASNKPRRISVIRFGSFEFDPEEGELRKAGRRIKLQEQPRQVLAALLEHAGTLVTREELRDRLWAKETFVDFDHSLNIAVNKIREALDDRAARPRFVETVPRRGYRFVAAVEQVVPEQAAFSAPAQAIARPWQRVAYPLPRLAVLLIAVAGAIVAVQGVRYELRSYRIAALPLKNLSGERSSDYFSDGLTDELIHHLSLIKGLEVTSRTSSFAFKDGPRKIRDVGRQLGVDLVLEGSVLRERNRLRITTDLVRVSDDTTIWSARYDREVGDLLTIEDEVSRSIVNELRLKHVGGERRYDSDAATYDVYLRAETLANDSAPRPGNAARLGRVIDLFQQVLSQQPDFAPAYAGIADVYANMRNRGMSRESARQMRQAAQRAIELDPLLPTAYAAIGLARAADLAWSDAEQAFRYALRLDPNLSRARRNFALFVLLPEDKRDEAVLQVRRAAALDPLSTPCQLELAFVLLHVGEVDEAMEIAQRVFTQHPSEDFAETTYARALLLKGKRGDALNILEKQGPGSHGYLGYAYGIAGRRADAERLAIEEDPAAARHQVLIYTGLGETDRAFEALQKTADMDDFMADLYPTEPELASLRDDPRMRDFRRRRHLPDR